MEKKLTFSQSHHLAKLTDELFAAFPGWVNTLPDGSREARASVSGNGTVLTLWVPATTDEAAVSAVVAAHNPMPPAPPADPAGFLRAILGALDGATQAAKLARAQDHREKAPGLTESFVKALEGPGLSATQAEIVKIVWARIKARAGTAQEVANAAEISRIERVAPSYRIQLV